MTTDPIIAGKLSVSPRHIRELRARGVFPPAGSDLETVLLAYIAHLRAEMIRRPPSGELSSLERERERLAREQADRAAMQNAEARGELVPIGPITQAVVGMIEVSKAKLARVPGKVAGSDAVLKRRIADAISDALVDLSDTRAVPARRAGPSAG
jgi:hypothetical protein